MNPQSEMSSSQLGAERRTEPRETVIGHLWMIDNQTSTILRCRCVDASPQGLRLRVPVGYGLRQGQEYELTSHLPGQSAPPGLGLMISRRAAVVRTGFVTAEDGNNEVEVGVRLAPSRRAQLDHSQGAVTALA